MVHVKNFILGFMPTNSNLKMRVFRPLATLAKDVVLNNKNYYSHSLSSTYETNHS